MNAEVLRYDGDRYRPRQAQRLPYLEKFGLTSPPFAAERQDWLLTHSPALRELLGSLLNEDWREILLCNAAIGELQPLLCAEVTKTLAARYQVITLQADLLMSAEELLYRITVGLGLEEEASGIPEVMIHALTDYVVEAQGRVQGVVLQVEDAHELSAEALSLLITLAEPHEGELPAKVMLWGDASLAARLRQALKGRRAQAAQVEIAPFEREEVEAYLAHCLAEAGYRGELPFSAAELERLYQESGGVPSRLHRLAEEALQEAASGRRFRLRYPSFHLTAASVLLLVLAGLNAGPLAEAGLNAAGQTGMRTITLNPEPASMAGQVARPNAAEADPAERQGRSAPQSGTTDAGITVRENAGSSLALTAPEPVGPPVINTNPLYEQRRAAAASAAEQDLRPVTAEVAGPPAGSTPAPVVASSDSAAEQVLAMAAAKPAVTLPVPVEVSAAQAPATPASSSVAEQHASLRALPAEHYVLQLFGTFSEENVKDFIADSGLLRDMYYFETRHQDKPWFVAVHGAFASRGEAEAAVARLPAALRQGAPWVRSLKDVRAAMHGG